MTNRENVFIHFEPTENELRRAFLEMDAADTLRFLPEPLRSVRSWMEYMHPPAGAARAIAFCPVVIEVDGRYPAVIWLTDYCDESRSAQVHFAAHAQVRPKTVLGAARLAVGMLLRSKEIDVLFAFFPEKTVRAYRMAQVLGFQIFHCSAAGCVYSLKATDALKTI